MKKSIALLVAGVVACGGADLGILGAPDGSTLDAVSPDDAAQNETSSANDASPDDIAAPDATVIDAGPPPYQDPGIACGKVDCDPDASLCCGTATSYYPQTTYSFACEPLSDFVQCAGGLPVYCDDDKDCPTTQSCCATVGYQSYSKVACQAGPCMNTVYGMESHFCDPKASDCDGNTTCKPAPYLSGYYACQ
jgi:hypothetical protein